MNWENDWKTILSLPEGAPQWLVAALVILLLVAAVVVPAAALVSLVDRKLGADLQARVGPNRAGPAGVFQPIADFIKTLLKEDAAESETSLSETLWILTAVGVLFCSLAFLPLASATLLVDTDMSALLPFFAAFGFCVAMAFFGLRRETVPGLLGGLRSAAQAVAGGFPALVALLAVGMRSAGFKWSQISGAQGFSPLSWTIFSNPFQFLGFLAFVGGGLVIFGIPPLDPGYSEGDLQGGVASGLRGRRLILFRLARFYGFFLWSVVTAALFLGAWALPEGARESLSPGMRFFTEALWLGFKTFMLMTVVIWSARVLPRVRAEQVTEFSWKVLSPFALVSLIGTAFWVAWGNL